MEKILIKGPAGQLEAVLHLAKRENSDFLIICHPHPQFGGTMDNKVVTTAAKTYLDLGINVIRFNYRGVGDSQGEYGDISGEVGDGLAVIKWLESHYPVSRIFLAGFSFGAYIAAKLAATITTDTNSAIQVPHLLLIAPSVENSPFELAESLAAPCTVIMGQQDEVVPYESVETWVAQQAQATEVELIALPKASHFFHGQLIAMKNHVKRVLKSVL